jgi:hypothetical protein
MARKQQSRGVCSYCGQELAKGGMSRHLAACKARQAVIAAANEEEGKGEPQKLYHLQVQDNWGGDFWLHLEMRESATLKKLDQYLRAIWLECCGHLSAFYAGAAWTGDEIPMSRKAAQVFWPDQQLVHIYDFGTSSETAIKVLAVREGRPTTPHPIALMARNRLPEYTCMECDHPARWLCMECVYEYDESGLLCDVHAEDHPHEDYGDPVPLLNSPRVGMCGYCGPDEPPY